MKLQKIFELNLLKLIIATIILIVFGFLSNELFMVCKIGADCTPPLYSYLSGIIFLIDFIYIILLIIGWIYGAIKNKK
jgi:hypothetical protein